MLVQRVVTSFALLLVILGAVFGLSATLFTLFIAINIALAIWEWSALAGLASLVARVIYLLCLLLIMFVTIYIEGLRNPLLIAGIIFWLFAFLVICKYPQGQKFWAKKLVLVFTALPLFIPGWVAILLIRGHQAHEFLFLLFLVLVAATDIGAYFTGKAYGSRKLAVMVSPNKTWEGFVGGLLTCSLLVFVITLFMINQGQEISLLLWSKLIFSALVIATFSVIGDLFESMVKRIRHVKDSGAILPGHGGILDRIDGMTSAAPVYAIILVLLAPEFL